MKNKVATLILGVSFIIGALYVFLLEGKGKNYIIEYEPGNSYTYNVSYTSNATGVTNFAQDNDTYKPDVNVDYKFKGKVVINVLDDDLNATKMEFVFKSDDFKSEINNKVNNHWPSDIVVSGVLGNDGIFKELYFQREYYDEFSPFLKDVLKQFQLPLTNSGYVEWQSVEEDFSSIYDIYYKLKKSFWPGLSLEFKKTYRARNPQLRLEQSADVSISRFFNRIDLLNMVRNRTTFSGGKTLSIDRTLIDIIHLSTHRSGYQSSLNDSDLVRDTLDGQYQKELLKKRMYEQTLGSNDVSSFSVRLRQVPSLNNRELAQLFYQLRAWVELDPSRLEQVKFWLNLYNVNHPSFEMLSTLLVSIGTPEAQDIMRNIMDAHSAKKQKAIMLKMVFLESPTIESEQVVRELTQTLSAEEQLQAKLVLGGMARSLLDDDRARSLAIYNEFSDELISAANNDEIENALSVIGNIGISEQTDTVKKYLSHDNKNIRYTALNALRFVNTSEAQGVLLDNLDNEDARMREIASTSLTLTTPGPKHVEVYKNMLKKETNKYVIRQVIDNLGQMSTQYPEAISVLEAYIPQIGVTSLKRHAEGVLNQIKR